MQRALKSGPERIPAAALWLGVAGLIPFVALPVLAAIGPGALPLPTWLGAHMSVPALLLYAAVILSFMGGVQWGLAIQAGERIDESRLNGGGDFRRYGASVVPALLAWLALLLDPRTGLFLLAVGFVGLLVYDIWTVRRGEAPGWYERLRLGLTSVVVLSISLTLTLVI